MPKGGKRSKSPVTDSEIKEFITRFVNTREHIGLASDSEKWSTYLRESLNLHEGAQTALFERIPADLERFALEAGYAIQTVERPGQAEQILLYDNLHRFTSVEDFLNKVL